MGLQKKTRVPSLCISSSARYAAWCSLLLMVIFSLKSSGFKQEDFKRCDDSSFCRRQRATKPEDSPYVADFNSFTLHDNGGSAYVEVTNSRNGHPYNLEIFGIKNGIFHVKMNEADPIKPRYEVPDLIQAVQSQSLIVKSNKADETISLQLTDEPHMQLTITCQPFKVDIYDSNEPVLSLNSKQLLNIEHLREKHQPKTNDEAPPAEGEEAEPVEEVQKEEDEELPGMWEETFKGHKDSKPRGPESIGLDTTFVNFQHVYGIPEHAEKLSLESTVGEEPYRLYNLDVFEYDLDSPAALYGSIPFMLAHNAKRTVGLLWLNSAETWIDVDKKEGGLLGSVYSYFAGQETIPEVDVHWMSESGIIDIYVMMGPTPKDVSIQYASLTGPSYMPPQWAVAYHQSRWNYKDEVDVATLDEDFDKHDIPCDCIWLDIEHTDGKRYFTWDDQKFPNPEEMQKNVASKGRKMVTIIDPHIKVDNNYHIYSEAKAKGYFTEKKDGGEFRGWCWPGDSAYLDFNKPEVRDWWASKFAYDQYKGSTEHLFTWNDMNEPSVFNGPEITMHKDVKHGEWEHRHVHNMYGLLQQMSTFKGQLLRSDGKERPFILSRAFFVGTQKYGAIWTGDNTAEWGHLGASVPMLLTIGLTGINHCGADVGGFFKDPKPEMLTRWYQAAAYQPFFRSHAHIETPRREPWLYDEKYKLAMREAVRERYELLPLWYTLFYKAHKTGIPSMRPLWYEFPSDPNVFATDDSFMVGDSLLVHPVARAGITASQVYLPGESGWYDVYTHQHYPSPNTASIPTPLERQGVLQRGGSIIPRKLRIRRSSSLMLNDPYTLFVALDNNSEAEGELYMDDGHTYDYQSGKYNYKKLKYSNKQLSSTSIDSNATFETKSWLEKVVIMGTRAPSSVTINYDTTSTPLGYTFDPATRTLTIRKPGVNMQKDWTINIS